MLGGLELYDICRFKGLILPRSIHKLCLIIVINLAKQFSYLLHLGGESAAALVAKAAMLPKPLLHLLIPEGLGNIKHCSMLYLSTLWLTVFPTNTAPPHIAEVLRQLNFPMCPYSHMYYCSNVCRTPPH